jgi:hypothetical protein
MGQYFYSLEKYKGQKTRYTCPNCRKPKEFTRYINTQTGEYIAENVGKCNRENKCGYHYSPSDYLRDNPQATNWQNEEWRKTEVWKTVYRPPEPKPIDFIPESMMKATFKKFELNNFTQFLKRLFGEKKANQLIKSYHLGTSKKWRNQGGYSVIFWQVDINGKIRQAKVMAYNPETGKRLKEVGKHYVSFLGKRILEDQNANLQQCLFGEHLLPKFPEKTVCLVESEKTAIIMAGIFPEYIWLATGGKNGARWVDESVYKVLEGRAVILFPDLGAYNEWKEKAKILGTVCSHQVSDLLEQKAEGNDREEGYDLADYFMPKLEKENCEMEKGAIEEPGKSGHLLTKELSKGFSFARVRGKYVLEKDGVPVSWLQKKECEDAK